MLRRIPLCCWLLLVLFWPLLAPAAETIEGDVCIYGGTSGGVGSFGGGVSLGGI